MSSVYVVGSINVDLVAFATRLPTRGETIRGNAFERFAGGKGANQAVAAARADARTIMVGAVGRDSFGSYMQDALVRMHVDFANVETVQSSTGVALIVVGGNDNQIVVVPGANDLIDEDRVMKLNFKAGDVCVAQLETTPAVVKAAFERARVRHAIAIFNPAPALDEGVGLIGLADITVVNETEAAYFTGTEFDLSDPTKAVKRAANDLKMRTDQTLVVTLGAQGVCAWRNGLVELVPGHKVTVVDTTGAGDCFCGFLAAAICRGEPFKAALEEANAAAALSVQTKGATPSMPDRKAVLKYLARSKEHVQSF